MRITLPVTEATLPRILAIRATEIPRGGKPLTFELPEADAARDADLHPDAPRPPPGRWFIASMGPILEDRGLSWLTPVRSVTLDVLAYTEPAETPLPLTASRLGWAR